MTRTPPKGLTVERVRELLSYDPETGVFRWRVARGTKVKAGDVAGAKCDRRVLISIDDHPYKAHILAWVIMNGVWPDHEVDHRDRDGFNNRWANLRPATRQQQVFNRGINSNNAIGVKGVTYDAERRKWRASIGWNRKRIFLGRFESMDEAREARNAAVRKYHGEFGVPS